MINTLLSRLKKCVILSFIVVLNLPIVALAAPIPTVDQNAIDGDYVNYEGGQIQTTTCSAGQTPAVTTGSVYVLGDSITNAARGDIQTRLTTAGFTVAGINAESGRAISVDTTATGKPTGLQAVADDAAIIASSEVVVIALGTNSGTEDLNVQIPALINAVRAASAGAQIYWVNLFFTSDPATRDSRNAIIASHATSSNYAVIDTTAAGIALGPDNIHPTVAGQATFANAIVSGINGQTPVSNGSPPTTVGDVSLDGNPFHILTYPNIIDEAAAAAAIDNYISSSWPTSPFVGLGSSFIAGAKRSNVNPFLAVGHLQVENSFATAGGGTAGWHGNTYATLAGALAQNQAERVPSYNAFGSTTSTSSQHVYFRRSVTPVGGALDNETPPGNDGYKVYVVKQWNSWQDSLDGSRDWFAGIRANYLNVGSTYESPDFATYVSHYAPSSDGNSEAAYIAGLLAVIDAVSAGVGVSPGNGPACVGAGAGSGSGQIGIDGYTFPLAPQTRAVGGITVGQKVTTHHDGTPAFDLFSTIPSADVYAIYGGVPTRINTNFNGIAGCSSIQFHADDGFYYWYGHLKNTVVVQGVHIASGTKIAQIADKASFTSACWGGAPHLHIDRGCSIGGVPQPGGSDACRDPTFIPFLAKIYEALPPG